MSILDFVLLLLIAGLAGSIGQALVGFSRTGCLMTIVTGFIGALLGTWLARQLGLPAWLTFNIGGRSFPFLWAIIGSALFVAVISLISRNRV